MKAMAWCAAAFAAVVANGADVTVDFGKPAGMVNPKLHSSGWGPRIYPRAICNEDAEVSAMGFYAVRTHDWALVNDGQRVVDTHHVFPLMHLDPKDPKNYVFEPTDEVLGLSRKLGLKLFYRLGTSIEHTEERHFNACAPKDYAKYAEVLAGIMRHYLKGWANGFEWSADFDGWEIWNEPDGIDNCWVLPDCAEKDWKKRAAIHRAEFVKFFAVVLKRLKAEFPDQQIGGPALCSASEGYFRDLLAACKEAGVAPDFISWHAYTSDPRELVDTVPRMRKLLDGLGFAKTRLILNEWHYIRTWDGIHGRNSTVAAIKRAHEGPSGHLNVDSAAMNLFALANLQASCLDEAFYYGCGPFGNWGYKNGFGEFNKCWYSMKMFGDFVRQSKTRVASEVSEKLKSVAAVAGLSADGRTATMLVVDYRGKKGKIGVRVNGLDATWTASACVLDHARNMEPIPVLFDGSGVTLARADENSAAFLVTFTKK